MISVEKIYGKKGVIIEKDAYDSGRAEVKTCRNGHQWSGMPMDGELLVMLRDAIDEFLTATEVPQDKKERPE